jgi:hypothetical protein
VERMPAPNPPCLAALDDAHLGWELFLLLESLREVRFEPELYLCFAAVGCVRLVDGFHMLLL